MRMPEAITSRKRVDVREAIRDRVRGLSYSEIAKKQNFSAPAVFKAIKSLDKLAINKDQLDEYRKREVNLLDAAKMKFLVAAVNDKKLKSASALQCVTGFAVLTDKSLLLQGKATQIIESKSLILQANKTLEEIQDRLKSAQIIDSVQDDATKESV